jgi:hypothetical protein
MVKRRVTQGSVWSGKTFVYISVWVLVLIFMMRKMVCSIPDPIATALPSLRGHAENVNPDYLFEANALKNCNHLIVVCGHAITVAESLDAVKTKDSVWSLLPYQKNQDLPQTFVEHIQRGVEVANADPNSLLIFSGGQSRPTAGPRSEGLSYWLVAEHFQWYSLFLCASYRLKHFLMLLFTLCISRVLAVSKICFNLT